MKNSKIQFGGKFVTKSKHAKVTYRSEVPNLEEDSKDELTELQKQFKAKAKHEAALKEANTQTESFSVIVFKTKEQRDQFHALLNIKSDDLQYINGEKLAKALELKIATVNLKNPGKFQCNKEIANLAMEI